MLATLVLLASILATPVRGSDALPTAHLERVLSSAAREAIPREYDKQKDWGRTKAITSGLRFDGKLRSLSVRRRKREVRHGVWKRYRVTVVDPEQSLSVAVTNVRSLGAGRAGCTVAVGATIDGWARVRHYNRGVHLGTVTFEGRSTMRVEIDCEVGVRFVAGKKLPAIQVDPTVTDARVDIGRFELSRVGELDGGPAREIGRAIEKVVRRQLDGPKLTAKLNRAIDKRRDRLRVDPSELVSD